MKQLDFIINNISVLSVSFLELYFYEKKLFLKHFVRGYPRQAIL